MFEGLETRFQAEFDQVRNYRYTLRGKTGHVRPDGRDIAILWIMLNPSTADELVADQTITRCLDFSARWGYTTLLVANLYAFRTAYPTKLFKLAPERWIGPANDGHIKAMLAEVQKCVVAWGANADHDRADQVLAMVREAGLTPWALGLTREGHPRHPLYVARNTIPKDLELWSAK